MSRLKRKRILSKHLFPFLHHKLPEYLPYTVRTSLWLPVGRSLSVHQKPTLICESFPVSLSAIEGGEESRETRIGASITVLKEVLKALDEPGNLELSNMFVNRFTWVEAMLSTPRSTGSGFELSRIFMLIECLCVDLVVGSYWADVVGELPA
ncbi:hypothetical protein Droror1_Dr00013930 [Drosera rotundifolia]